MLGEVMDLDFVKSWSLKLLPYLGVLVVGAGLGWKLKPDVVKVEEKVVEKTVEKKDERIDEVLAKVSELSLQLDEAKTAQKNEKYHKERTETRNPDGTVVIKETTDKNVNSVVTETKKETEVKVVEVEKQVVVTKEVVTEKQVFVDKIVTPVLPNWHVGLLAGAAPRFDSPASTPVMVGLEAERRLAGPFWIGAWTMAGSPVTAFSVTNASAGIKVGLEF
jgi:hypothetical protein